MIRAAFLSLLFIIVVIVPPLFDKENVLALMEIYLLFRMPEISYILHVLDKRLGDGASAWEADWNPVTNYM